MSTPSMGKATKVKTTPATAAKSATKAEKVATAERRDELHRAIQVKGIRIAISCSVIGVHFCSGRTRLLNSGLNTLQGHRFGRRSSLSWVSLGNATETTEIGGR